MCFALIYMAHLLKPYNICCVCCVVEYSTSGVYTLTHTHHVHTYGNIAARCVCALLPRRRHRQRKTTMPMTTPMTMATTRRAAHKSTECGRFWCVGGLLGRTERSSVHADTESHIALVQLYMYATHTYAQTHMPRFSPPLNCVTSDSESFG